MEIKMYWLMIRKGWWLIVLTALIAVNMALITIFFATPTYRATVNYLVHPNPKLLPIADMVSGLESMGTRSIMTYSELLKNDLVIVETVKQLNLDIIELGKRYKIATLVLPDTSIIELSVEGPDPKLCAQLASNLGKNGVDYIHRFYDIYDVNLIKPATIPKYPVSPQPVRDLSLALIFGLIVGTLLAILSEQIRVPLESLRQRKLFNSLSGVYTRQHFERLIETEMLSNRERGTVFSVGLVRLDGLAEVIDTLPVVVVEKIFKHSTQILRELLKGGDILGLWDQTTYAILLPSTPYVNASNIMKRICQALSIPIEMFQEGEALNLNPYAGVVHSFEYEPPKDFIDRAQRDLDERRFGSSPDDSTAASNPQKVKL